MTFCTFCWELVNCSQHWLTWCLLRVQHAHLLLSLSCLWSLGIHKTLLDSEVNSLAAKFNTSSQQSNTALNRSIWRANGERRQGRTTLHGNTNTHTHTFPQNGKGKHVKQGEERAHLSSLWHAHLFSASPVAGESHPLPPLPWDGQINPATVSRPLLFFPSHVLKLI